VYISSPRSDNYKTFVTQTQANEWYFPVWDLHELQLCRNECYSTLDIQLISDIYRIYGGVAHYVFYRNNCIVNAARIDTILMDINAVRGLRYYGQVSDIFLASHLLMHILVSDDVNRTPYQYIDLDIASKYIGELLWDKYKLQMITNLNEMFGYGPLELI
jgi:hypothetical protein